MESIGSVGSGICLWKPLIGCWVRVSERCRIKGTGVNEVDVGEIAVEIYRSTSIASNLVSYRNNIYISWIIYWHIYIKSKCLLDSIYI